MQYNEWVNSDHACSLASMLESEDADDSCLTCHSNAAIPEGFHHPVDEYTAAHRHRAPPLPRPHALLLAAFMVITGLVINRWNMTLSGFVIPLDWSPGVAEVFPINQYEPAPVEWGVASGIVAYRWRAFTPGVRYLRLYSEARDLKTGKCLYDGSHEAHSNQPLPDQHNDET